MKNRIGHRGTLRLRSWQAEARRKEGKASLNTLVNPRRVELLSKTFGKIVGGVAKGVQPGGRSQGFPRSAGGIECNCTGAGRRLSPLRRDGRGD